MFNTFTVWTVLGVYEITDHNPMSPPAVVTMPSWVPFWPPALPLYGSMLLVTWFLPVAIREARRFRACQCAMVVAFLLIIPWWILTPTTLPRPPLPSGFWAGPYESVVALDPPNNIFPCGHGVGAWVAAWFAGRDHPAWRWTMAGALALGLPSIALTWQHRPIDIVTGLVAATIGIVAGEALFCRRIPQP